MIIGIEHVAIAAQNVDDVRTLFGVFGLEQVYQEDLAGEGVRSTQLGAGNANIEVLTPLREDAAVVRFLASHGPGLHHVCFRVDDLDATIERMRAAGLRLVDPQPREDGQGRRVFLHPRSGAGTLMGFVERHRDP